MFHAKTLFLMVTLFGLCGCQVNDVAVSNLSVSGEVSASNSIQMSPSLDGKGTLYIAMLEQCDLKAPLAGVATVPNADLSQGHRVAFTIEAAKEGRYFLATFMDEQSLTPKGPPRPTSGDMVYSTSGFGDGKIDCVEVSVPQKERVHIELTGRRP